MNVARVIRKYLGRKYNNSEVDLIEQDGNIFINQWNIAGTPKPTQAQLNSIWTAEESNINQEVAIEVLNAKHYPIFIEGLFENYKQTDAIYKQELQDITG